MKQDQQHTDEIFMRRCLQLAACGRQNAKPNPMVGAVIVSRDGRIIGEGYHVRCGEGHAEVNAFASVRPEDEPLLHESTIYVSLEPCSHFGKTPPCADLIVAKRVRRVVVGCIDPFSKVSGRGIRKLRSAGIDVTVGVLEHECLRQNRRFITMNTRQRPFITLKWAQSLNGFIDDGGQAVCFSTDYTAMLVHKLRSECDAILVGRTTDEREHPQLNVRHWAGKDPLRLVLDSQNPLFPGLKFDGNVVQQLLDWLYARQCQSLIVEGGRQTLQSFIDADAWDEIRIETAPLTIADGTRAPQLPQSARLASRQFIDGNTITLYEHRL